MVFPLQRLAQLLHGSTGGTGIRHRHHRFGGHGDGIVFQSAPGMHQTQFPGCGSRLQQTAQQHVRVGPALVDLGAGMAAGQTADRHPQAGAVIGRSCHRQHAVRPAAAGAADGEHALSLGVQVQQRSALQRGDVQPPHAVHAHLFFRGEYRLQAGMDQAVIVQQCQGDGHGNAVVAAQGGSLGVDGVAVHHQIQTLAAHILGTVRRLFAHHVQMPLENQGLRRLVPRRGLLDDDDVVQFVLMDLQSPFPGKRNAPVADGSGVA